MHAKEGDSYARYLVRVDEMRESLHILKQIVDTYPKERPLTRDTVLRQTRANHLQSRHTSPEYSHPLRVKFTAGLRRQKENWVSSLQAMAQQNLTASRYAPHHSAILWLYRKWSWVLRYLT